MTDDLKTPDGRRYRKSALTPEKTRENAQDFGWLVVIALSTLTTRLAQKERVLRSREDRTMILYNLAKEIASANPSMKSYKEPEHF